MTQETERFRLLIDQFLSVHDKRIDDWGAKSWLAKQFGLDTSTINKILGESRGAGEAARDKVCAKLGLDAGWFKTEDLGTRTRYSQWLTKREPEKTYPAAIAKFFGLHPELLRFRDTVAAELQGRRGEVTDKMVIKAVGDLEAEEREAKMGVSSR
jgi:hypothetical protein